MGDVAGNGLPDVSAKPWNPRPEDALRGRMHDVFLAEREAGGGARVTSRKVGHDYQLSQLSERSRFRSDQ